MLHWHGTMTLRWAPFVLVSCTYIRCDLSIRFEMSMQYCVGTSLSHASNLTACAHLAFVLFCVMGPFQGKTARWLALCGISLAKWLVSLKCFIYISFMGNPNRRMVAII